MFLSPLYYYLIDHSGFHNSTSKLLSNFFSSCVDYSSKGVFCVPKLTEGEAKSINKLLEVISNSLHLEKTTAPKRSFIHSSKVYSDWFPSLFGYQQSAISSQHSVIGGRTY